MATLPEGFAGALENSRAGRHEAAISECERILAADPACWQAWHLAGVIAREQGRNGHAADCFARAVAANPSVPALHRDLGEIHLAQQEFEHAVVAYERALNLQPDSVEAHHGLGLAWNARGDTGRAAACFERALQLDPKNTAAHNNLAVVYRKQGKWKAAAASCRRALEIDPAFVEAWNNLANVLLDTGQPEEAADCCRRALELKPSFADARLTLGNVLKDQRQLDAAIACYRQVLALNPGFAPALSNLGAILKDQGQLDEAIACFRQVMQSRPDNRKYHSNLLYTLNFHPQYDGPSILDEHRRWARRFAELVPRFTSYANDRSPDRRLRVGYVSPDFRSHSVGRFLLPLLEAHDRSQVEIFCYSTVKKPDALTERCRARASVWRDVLGKSDGEIADSIHSDRIDILVDLTMHMEDNRLLIFARKPAPVQLTYLAYCGTTGLDTIDCRFTDPYLDPPGSDESCYSERSVRLPETYWCYEPIVTELEVAPLPARSSGRITFGCLNNFCKVTPPALDLWAQILEAVPESQLLLHAPQGSCRDRVRDYFSSRGIAPERVRFAGWMNVPDYFRLYNEIDLALDSIPHGGGTTTCDALWMGVPVISLAGSTAVSRSGYSLLSNVGASELVAFSPQQYVRKAAQLASDLARLEALRRSLRGRMQASPLMDRARFARNVETAYRQMWASWCASFDR